MALVGIVIDDMFEDVEYTEPSKAFKEASHSLIHIGLRSGQEKEKRHLLRLMKIFLKLTSTSWMQSLFLADVLQIIYVDIKVQYNS